MRKTSFPLSDNLRSNPYIAHKTRHLIKPYLIPNNHPIKPTLDAIFKANRATQDVSSFSNAGFHILFSQPRSYIRVARHPDLPGYLIKTVLDSELRMKHDVPEWKWFVKRCKAANQIRKTIFKYGLQYFKVPRKFIYTLPKNPSPPNDPNYSRKIIVLVVEDMDLVPKAENKLAWRTKITKEILDELFTILSHSPGMTVRADNIVFTQDDKLAFIDTEYDRSRPHYRTITKYLSGEMQRYWNSLINKLDRLP